MTKEKAIAIFNANYKKEWRESDNEKRRKAITSFWNNYVDQLLYVDKAIDEATAVDWYNSYYNQ